MSSGDTTPLSIERLPDGGFLIKKIYGAESFWPVVFACTDISEALKYIERKLAPEVMDMMQRRGK